MIDTPMTEGEYRILTNEIVGCGLRLTTALKRARARLQEHHSAEYSPEWGQKCNICINGLGENIFSQIDDALGAWEELFIRERI